MVSNDTASRARPLAGLQLYVQATSLSVIVLGSLTLIGWEFSIEALKRVFPNLPLLMPNTAIAFILAGLSLSLLRHETAGLAARRTGQTLAIVVALFGAVTLCEYLFNWRASIDQVLFGESLGKLGSQAPGRASFLGALNFLLLGMALLLLDWKSRFESRPFEILTATAMVISLLALIGYACNAPYFYAWESLFSNTGMALHTTVGFVILSGGLFCARPERGLMKILTSPTPSGTIVRRLLLTPVLIPLVTGLVRIAASHTGIYNPELAGWLFAFMNIFLMTCAIWWSATLLYRAEMVRQRTEQELSESNAQLEQRVIDRTAALSQAFETLRESKQRVRLVLDTALDAVITMDSNGVVTSWNHEAEKTFGWSREEIVGQRLGDMIIPPRYREAHERALRQFLTSRQGALMNKRIEISALHKDGHDFSVELAITPIKLGEHVFFSAFARDITGRKQAEEARLSAEAKFRRLVEQSIAGIYVIQGDRFAYVNPKMAEIFGCSREELTSVPVFDFIAEENHSIAKENIQKRLSGAVESIHYGLRMKRRDGRIIDVEVHGSRTEYHGEPAILGTLLDITERKRAEKTVLEAEQKYRSIFDNAIEGIFQSTPSGKFLAANPAMARILGYSSPEEIMRERTDIAVQGYVNPAQREEFKRRLETNGEVNGFEYEAYQKNGNKIWVSENVRAVRDSQGELLYYEGSLEDITERKRAEQLLAVQHAVTAVLAESASLPWTVRRILQIICQKLDWNFGALWMVDKTAKTMRCLEMWPSLGGPLEKFAAATRKLTFASGAGVPGRTWAAGKPTWIADVAQDSNLPRKSVAAQCGLHAAFAFPICLRDEVLAVAEFYSAEMRPPDAELLAMCVTVGSQLGQFIERTKIKEQLRQSQKMEAIGTLAGGIAHDFNNILTAIVGNAELLKSDVKRGGLAHLCATEIVKATERATELVRRILTFSRKQDQRRAIILLQPVISEAASLLRASLPATIEIRKSIDSDCPTVLADPTQIHQIVMNLATNAAHAMRTQEGCLEIELSCFEVDPDFARAHAPLQPGRCVRLRVTDTGCGMDTTTVERMFEPFFTTKLPGEGTGLGLSVVHGIVQSHDGAITVYSEPGKGTTFNLFFPVVSAAAEETVAPSRRVPSGDGQEILFVDDEKAITELARILLPRIGYTPTICHSAAEALATFRAEPDRFDAVITDLTMPQMTGVMLAREVHSLRPRLPIILATGYSGASDFSRAREAGIEHLLAKPFSLQSLAENLNQVLSHSA